MKTHIYHIVGFFLASAASIGLLFSILGIWSVWYYKKPVTDQLMSSLAVTALTLKTTSDGLTLIDQTLNQTAIEVNSLKTTIQSTSSAIHDTTPLVKSLKQLVAEELPNTILAAQTSLLAAKSGAQVIETTLKALTSIPLLPVEPYNPPVPLPTALTNVSDSLEPLPDAFKTMESSLNTSQGNLILIESELNIMARNVGEINGNLRDALNVIDQYQNTVTSAQDRVAIIQADLPGWMNSLAIFLTFGLVWLGITQAGLLLQSLIYISHSEKGN
jgi:peptidoglycan hydrolase CwlO-like protein